MRYRLRLTDKREAKSIFSILTEEPTHDRIVHEAVRLYQEANPAPFKHKLVVEVGHGVLLRTNTPVTGERVIGFTSRIRFAKEPTSGGNPRWGRWHDLYVELLENEVDEQ